VCSGAGHGGPGHVVSPPASKADGRRKPVWEFDSPALRHLVPGDHHGEVPKLDKGPPWNGGRRGPPVRGFESHSLRCHHHCSAGRDTQAGQGDGLLHR
jgi:hypothetical protein